ncbi:hypothetical protein BCR39DRAFT_524331 [Naematelia encephala]|uniref:Uncharacterized protein n=1 Tax=Naematelia encephala TaxID=71784 RepID=A0A1Y2BBC7_9TREE|nr:hypothetical protein BCR39DRAFT_524331 [Naematelia encephala]
MIESAEVRPETRPLTRDELWASWDPCTKEEREQVFQGSAQISEKLSEMSVEDRIAQRGKDVVNRDELPSDLQPGSSFPRIRSAYEQLAPFDLLSQRLVREGKLKIYEDVINFCTQDPEGKQYKTLWNNTRTSSVKAIGIDTRLRKATEGKEVANRQYKEKNWFGAMYTYAIAWGYLLPYHLDAFSRTDPTRQEFVKLESALFSNISAMALVGAQDQAVKDDMKPGMLHLGLRAAECCISIEDVTVGIMIKSVRRAFDIRTLLNDLKDVVIDGEPVGVLWDPKDVEKDLKFYKAQEKALKGIAPDTFFKDVEPSKKTRRPWLIGMAGTM